jgi:hypothetical protein
MCRFARPATVTNPHWHFKVVAHRHNGIYCPPSGAAAAPAGQGNRLRRCLFSVPPLSRSCALVHSPHTAIASLPVSAAAVTVVACLPFRLGVGSLLAACYSPGPSRPLLRVGSLRTPRVRTDTVASLSPNARRLRLASLWLASRRLSRSYSAPARETGFGTQFGTWNDHWHMTLRTRSYPGLCSVRVRVIRISDEASRCQMDRVPNSPWHDWPGAEVTGPKKPARCAHWHRDWHPPASPPRRSQQFEARSSKLR